MSARPAARIGDAHVCPMVEGGKPHAGGPINGGGSPDVLIGGAPAARLGDGAVCAGPADAIVGGSSTVLIGGAPAARLGDATRHGGLISSGCATVLIGGPSAADANGGADSSDAPSAPRSRQERAASLARNDAVPFMRRCKG